ncbi:sensor histidine kinase [Sphaerisporangium aureirubrum]|uniref:histidine kinase n=1 Tax=Sphaerisporangium aureirubrum TaxID=1544736 RepID=A0ABW1NVX7_9ACTN
MDQLALYGVGGLSAQVVAGGGLAVLGVVVIVLVLLRRRRRRAATVLDSHARHVLELRRFLLRVQYDYPRPTLADLVQSSRRGGLTVRLHVAGAPSALPDDVDLAAMRIVHEALVNVYQHGTASATVTLRYRPDRVVITVDSSLKERGAPSPRRHRGVEAMRHRAGRVGGTVSAGAHEGGWRVHAELPLVAQTAFV